MQNGAPDIVVLGSAVISLVAGLLLWRMATAASNETSALITQL